MCEDEIGRAVLRLRLWEAANRDDSDVEDPLEPADGAPVPERVRTLLRLLLDQPESQQLRRMGMVDAIRSGIVSSGAGVDPDRLASVLEAMALVPRHEFVDELISSLAYLPTSIDIGAGQVISHPHQVALMTMAACVPAGGDVLDVGTGSGYQAAVLSVLAANVVSIEILEPLALERFPPDMSRGGFTWAR